MKAISWIGAGFLLLAIGCSRGDLSGSALGKIEVSAKDKVPSAAVADRAPAVKEARAGEWAPADAFVAQKDAVDDPAPKGGGNQPKPPAKVARKIRYTADLKLITDEFDKTRDALQKLIDKHQGYEALADIRSSPGDARFGTWRVRVPIENFAAFREAARKLAEVESDTVNTEDLTDQYYDLDSNIKNLKAEQESWRDMLKRTTDKVENLIAVKRELDRVTDEIQRKEGRLRLMASLTELTTVNVSLRERQKFNPEKGPESVEAATFGMRAGKTFENSWGALRSFGQGFALFVIWLGPWLPVIALAGAPVVYVWRQRQRHVHGRIATPATGA